MVQPMTTSVFLTVDTEMSPALHQRGQDKARHFASSILGRCGAGDFGITYQMQRMSAAGVKGVFFVDPMPALVYGPELIADIVGPIVAGGHEVQLHIHTEWLEWASTQPAGALRGHSIKDFPYTAQVELLGLARELLMTAGAPSPAAFRAGNYGANDDTLRALAEIGIAYDSSFNPGYLGAACQITLEGQVQAPMRHQGLIEVPISVIGEPGGGVRHAQICALSRAEMAAALHHAVAGGAPSFVIVTHSFELLSRDRQRLNAMVKARFDAVCGLISATKGAVSTGFLGWTPPERAANVVPLRPHPLRRLHRMAEQGWSALRYEWA
jgi:hypothetical protein